VRTVSRRVALDQLSATDRDIVAVLSEHRVATTQQIATLLELPERTARYRLDRLWRLGMCGGRQPYADQGSAPYHWWPSRLADAFHRGQELPRGGEREEPQEQFLRHSAAITGLYVALVRLAPSLEWELLAFEREVEAREEFRIGERKAAIVPDAFVVVREGDAEYHAMVEIDRGTMSFPRLGRKLSLYLAWVASGVWKECHPFVPALLLLTSTPRRVEQIVTRVEERCRTEARTAPSLEATRCIEGFVVAATDAVDRPEAALVDPVWTGRGKIEGLRLSDLLQGSWEHWQAELERRQVAEEESDRHWQEIFEDVEGLRRTVQALSGRRHGIRTYSDHLEDLGESRRDALELLLDDSAPMTGLERRAFGFFSRRTVFDDLGRPRADRELVPLGADEHETIDALRDEYLARQREFVATLHARYPHLPWALHAIRRLGARRLLDHYAWADRHERTRKELAELKRLQGRTLDYPKWRALEVSNRQWGANLITRHTAKGTRRLARAIDEEQLRLCPECEQLVVPSRDDLRYQVGYCPFCGGRDELLTLSEAEQAGLVEPDGEESWRIRHGSVPGWATSQPLPPLDEDDEIDLEEAP
jgi:DNA-binding Lrp family transcriptional regulator